MTKQRKSKNTKTDKNELTIREFKVWLDGLCSFNTDDWTPNLNQWTLIKQKLMNLREDSGNLPSHQQSHINQPVDIRMHPRHAIPILSESEPLIPLPAEPTPEQLARKIEQAKMSSTTIKTPNIDTQNGYRSNFE